jgi:two-component system sensor histidine kinase PilS (NtrC family)
MPVSPLRRKLLWLLAARAAVVTLLLGSATLIQSTSPGARPVAAEAFFGIIGITYALTVIYALLLHQTEQRRWLVDLQVGVDALIVSAIVYLTGGINSYFSSLYTLPIIAATIVESRRGGLMVGLLSCLMYVGIVIGQYAGAAGFESSTALPATRLALFTVGLNLFGFGAIAALTGYLAEGLRQADIQLQRASNQIEDLQAFSRHIIDSLTSGLATTDIEGQILTFNRAASTITGVPVEEAVGRPAIEVLGLPPEFTPLFGAQPQRPKLPRIDVAFRRRDGRRIELGLSTALLFTPRGEVGFLLTFQDVTEVRRQDREARVQQRLAAVGEMAAGIAHEIRNPLASMAGSIQILRHEVELTPEQSQLMDIVLRESERLNETIRSFLAYARPQRHALSRVDARLVVTDAAALLENSPELTAAHRIAVNAPGEPVWLRADESQLRQIVWNLASNGLRSMPDGGTLTLAVRAVAATPGAGGDSDGEVVIEVSDQGTGIAPDQLDGIFQPFHAGFARGTGLGLSIVQRIVADYGGEIQVTSDRGSGTTVLVRLPVAGDARRVAALTEKVS